MFNWFRKSITVTITIEAPSGVVSQYAVYRIIKESLNER